MDDDTIADIAAQHGINTSNFIDFINERFPNERDQSYVHEWAERISNQSHYRVADNHTREALNRAGYKPVKQARTQTIHGIK